MFGSRHSARQDDPFKMGRAFPFGVSDIALNMDAMRADHPSSANTDDPHLDPGASEQIDRR